MTRPTTPLSDSERLDWLCLSRGENVGPITFFDLLRIYGSAGEALKALPELARRGGRRGRIKLYSRDRAAAEAEALAAIGGRLVALTEPDYPVALAAISDPPPVISVLGHGHVMNRDTVAIVGARNASAVGGRFARELAAELGAEGYTIASGLARGIDTQAHVGALPTGTVAVVAGGVDVIYPPDNAELYRQIAEAGAVISEQPLGMEPRGRHFPRRNRIISGLAFGLVVVEASLRTGSLITARLAGEQGREVFAVPGSPLDPRHRGTNNLIRQGAVLTESARDVVEALRGMTRPKLDEPPIRAPADMPGGGGGEISLENRQIVIDLLGPSPVAVDEIIRQCQLTPTEVLTVLLELELAGHLARHSGGAVSIDMKKT